jgi:DNA repair protein RecO (recombination protein O)
LDEKRPHLSIVVIFLIRFFEYIGYRPDLSHCLHCSRPVSAQGRYGFNYTTGCLIGATCSSQGFQTMIPLSPGTIKLLTTVQHQPLDRLHRLQFSTLALEESLNMLHRFGRQLFQRDIHSWEALRREGK